MFGIIVVSCHAIPKQFEAVYTGHNKVTIVNPFVLHVRSSAGKWSTSEIERGLSLLMGICCIMTHVDNITYYNGFYWLLCHIALLTSSLDTALQGGSILAYKKVVEILCCSRAVLILIRSTWIPFEKHQS